MQHHKQTIQLSDHVKNKIIQHQLATPVSFSSDELSLSDITDDDNGSPTPEKLYRRRSSTFVTYEIRQPSKSGSFLTNKSIDSKQNSSLKRHQLCQECLRRETFLQNEHQRLLHVNNENRKLTEQLRSEVLLNRHYHEENSKLKHHLTKLNTHLKEYQINFDLLRQQLKTEKTKKSKDGVEVDQLKRLRRELQVYNQVVAEKQQEEQKQIDYYSHRNWTQRK